MEWKEIIPYEKRLRANRERERCIYHPNKSLEEVALKDVYKKQQARIDINSFSSSEYRFFNVNLDKSNEPTIFFS